MSELQFSSLLYFFCLFHTRLACAIFSLNEDMSALVHDLVRLPTVVAGANILAYQQMRTEEFKPANISFLGIQCHNMKVEIACSCWISVTSRKLLY